MKRIDGLVWKLIFAVTLLGCSLNGDDEKPQDVWDIDTQGIPKIVSTNYIELTNIYQISRFRSSVGHDYSDYFENCRSMKHYFQPKPGVDWTTIKIFSPVAGTITRVEQESLGTKIEIQSNMYIAFRFQIFHISPAKAFKIGDSIDAGEWLGNHASGETYSDISVIVNDPTKSGRFVSYFYVITDYVMQQYLQRGATSREDFIISKELRDANPLDCDNFGINDPLANMNWFTLN